MANQELIDEIIAKSAFDQLDKAKSGVSDLTKAFEDSILAAEKLNNVLAGSSGLKDFDKKAEAQRQSIAKTQIAEEKLQQAKLKTQQIEETIAAKRQAIADRQIAKDAQRTAQLERQTRTVVSNSQAEVDAYNSTANGSREVTDTLNQQDRALGQLTNSLTAHTQAVTVDNNNTNRANTGRRSSGFLLEEERQNLRRSNLELRNQVREANAVQGSLEQRRAALIRLNAVYDNQSPQERASASGLRLNRIITGLTDQVSQLESATGRNQRNVGNYSSALGRAFSSLKTIANILPGVGIAGLIGFATEPIIEYISQLDIFKRTAKELVNDAALSDGSYKKAISDVNQLGVAVDEFHSGLITGSDLLKTYNEGIGQTAGQLKTAAEAEAFYNDKAPAFVEAMLLRAKANAALQIATEKTIEAQKRASGDNTFIDYLKSAGLALGGLFSGSTNGVTNFIGNANNARIGAVNDLNAAAKDGFKLFAKLQKVSDEFAKKNGLKLNGSGKGASSKINTDALDAQKAQVEALRATQKSIYEDETNSYEERISALNNFHSLSEQLNLIDAQKKLKNGQSANVVEKQRLLDNVNTEIEVNKTRYKLIEEDRKKSIEALKKLGEREVADRLTLLDAQSNALIKAEQSGLLSAAKSYSSGLINEREYQDLKMQIQRETLAKSVALEIQSVKNIIEIKKRTGQESLSDQQKLRDLEDKLAKNSADYQIALEEKKADAKKKLNDELMKLGQEVFNFAVAIGNAGFEEEKNRLQEESDLLDQRTKRDIENVTNSVGSEQEKADKIAIINAKAEAQKRSIEAREREVAQRQARFQKAASIAQLIANTAVAVMKTYAEFGFPLGVPLAITQAAIGAVQVATVLATPIPKYFRGTNSSRGGMALTDEGGAELYLPPSGSPYIGSDSPNIKNLQAGTRIIPHDKLVRMMAKPELIGREVGNDGWKVEALLGAHERGNKLLGKIVKKKSVGVSQRGWFGSTLSMNKVEDYRRRNGVN